MEKETTLYHFYRDKYFINGKNFINGKCKVLGLYVLRHLCIVLYNIIYLYYIRDCFAPAQQKLTRTDLSVKIHVHVCVNQFVLL